MTSRSLRAACGRCPSRGFRCRFRRTRWRGGVGDFTTARTSRRMRRLAYGLIIAAIGLGSCSGGGSTASVPPTSTAATPAPSLSYTWTASFAPGMQTGQISFPPWIGDWPDVNLASATVTLTSVPASSVSLKATAGCATVKPASATSFVVTQGNSGVCFLVAESTGAAIAIPVSAGFPPYDVLFLEVDGQPATSTAVVLPRAAQAAAVSAYDYREPLGPERGTLFTATSYGRCASVSPASSSTVPSTFQITRTAAAACFVIISDTVYESQIITLQ